MERILRAVLTPILFVICTFAVKNTSAQSYDTINWQNLLQQPYRIVINSSDYYNKSKDISFNKNAETDLKGLINFLTQNPKKYVEIKIPASPHKRVNVKNYKRLTAMGNFVLKGCEGARGRIIVKIGDEEKDYRYNSPQTIIFSFLKEEK